VELIPLPFSPASISGAETCARDRLLKRSPIDIGGVVLKELSSLLGEGEVSLHIAGISSGLVSRQGFAAVALSLTSDARSPKAVLGLDSFFAARVVDATLGRSLRSGSFSVKDCSFGEIGALIFALDRLGKDWLDVGGDSFVVRGLLEDLDQIVDYMDEPLEFEVAGRLHMAETDFPVRLWCSAPSRNIADKKRSLRAAFPWNVRVAVCAGWSSLSIDDVSTLAVGDRILLDAWNHPLGKGTAASPSCLFWNRSFHRFGRFISNTEIEVESTPGQEMNMDGKSQSFTPEQKWTLLSDNDDDAGMNVAVRVEVGSLKMPVQEALSLVPGRVIKLDRPVGPEVTVYVGDKLLGRGELVDVDGNMAVEIKELRQKS
jgi:flagellar motor switch protein FliN/FliY